MSDKLNVRCNACVMESYGQSGCLPHVEGCPFVTDPIDKEAEAAWRTFDHHYVPADMSQRGERLGHKGVFCAGFRAARSAAPVAPSEPEAVRPTDAELIDELDSLLSDVHAGIGSEDAKQVKDSFRAYGQLRAKIGTLVTLTRASAVEPGEAEHLEEGARLLSQYFGDPGAVSSGKLYTWLEAERIRRAKR